MNLDAPATRPRIRNSRGVLSKRADQTEEIRRPTTLGLIREDWEFHGRSLASPGFRALLTYRFGAWRQTLQRRALRIPLGIFYRMMYRYVRNHHGIELPPTAEIGRRVRLIHYGGVVVHKYARIGDDCRILHGVTIGALSEVSPDTGPRIGKGVTIGTGAVILGSVAIGDGAHIGPNAVILSDVAPNATAFVPPAKIMAAPASGWSKKPRND